MKYFTKLLPVVAIIVASIPSFSQYTRQDTLRGTINAERDWWNVLRYDITVRPDYAEKKITGRTSIVFKVVRNASTMQIDLQEPLVIDSIQLVATGGRDNGQRPLSRLQEFSREGNVYHIATKGLKAGSVQTIDIYYHGKPREAVRAPWDGGWVWANDDKGRPWMTVACQGLGASVWYPCKDHQSDEPDNGASLTITVADSLVAVGNGRLVEKKQDGPSMTSWKWEVKNPINNYTIIPYIGKYVNWTEEFAGVKGKLDCSYWVLDYNLEKSKQQFGRDVKPMLQCFENWFGPYPFYEDGFKLVESSHLGMEHQSAIAYGNKFMNGYLGMDLSGSGWGRSWDYIIVHEAGHEWFANNITTKDIADMWVHEGFTNYSEVLFVECQHNKKAGDEYCQVFARTLRTTAASLATTM